MIVRQVVMVAKDQKERKEMLVTPEILVMQVHLEQQERQERKDLQALSLDRKEQPDLLDRPEISKELSPSKDVESY